MKRITTSLTFLFSFFFFISFSYSQTIRYVPTDFPIIQDAINASEAGDTVIIEEGNYVQQINFKGKAITVGSRFILDPNDSSYIDNTIIDGAFLPQTDSSSLVYFISGEDSNSVLCGLTLQNGRGTYEVVPDWHDIRFGGAIEISNSGATIRKNIIKNCYCISSAWMNSGAAIDCFELPESKTIIIDDNKILNNEASGGNRAFGGAIECEAISGRLIITKNVIKNNEIGGAQLTGGGGVCILYSNSENITISNNFINMNTSNSLGTSRAGGIYVVDSKRVEIFNNIISENNCLSSYSFGGGINIGNWSTNSEVETIAKITNNTIVKNSAKREGGGISLVSIEAEIMNNIIRSNDAPTKKQLSFITMQTDPMVTYSNIEGGYEGEGNIDANPYFCDTTYCLLDNDISKCIDAGNPNPRYNDNTLVADDALYPSRGTKRNDMGAFGGPNSKWDQMSIIPSDPATSIENYNFNMPESFELSQNYPNPFNPTTTIKYSLPSDVKRETKNVKLIVYDIIGREITTLVNEKQKPGFYEVEWNASNVPSGVYFYKLKVRDFIETKKMLFLK